MNNKCLLTYAIDGKCTFDWFEDSEELEDFFRQQLIKHGEKFKVFEAIEIQECTNICLL